MSKVDESMSSDQAPSTEKIRMGPIDTYRKYGNVLISVSGKFPWRLTVHLLLVVATSAQVMILCEGMLGNSRAELRYFYFWFLQNETTMYNGGDDYTRYVYVFDVDQLNTTLRGHIDVLIHHYYNP